MPSQRQRSQTVHGSPGLVATEWDAFAEVTLPRDCSAVQRREMRLAFYGGASAVFFALLNRLTGGQEAEEADLTMLKRLGEELQQFADDVKEGHA